MFSVPNQQNDALSATQENDEDAHLIRVTGGASYKTGFATQWTLLINMKPFIRFVLGEEGIEPATLCDSSIKIFRVLCS